MYILGKSQKKKYSGLKCPKNIAVEIVSSVQLGKTRQVICNGACFSSYEHVASRHSLCQHSLL